jgi:hypothetical protein
MPAWEGSPTWTSLTISGLNSLADGSVAVSSTTVTNGTGADFYMDVSLFLGSFNPSGAPFIELHLVPLMHDGTTYPDVLAGGPTVIATAQVATGASTKEVIWTPPRYALLIPPGTFQVGIGNRTGTAFAASGNALQVRPYAIV